MQRLAPLRKRIAAQVSRRQVVDDDAPREAPRERAPGRKPEPTKFAPSALPMYVGAAIFGALIIAFAGEFLFGGTVIKWAFWAIAFAVGGAGVFLARLMLNSILNRAAPFMLSPRGIKGMEEAQEMLMDYLENDSLPRLVVREGQFSQDAVATIQTLRHQPGRLEVDRVSAVLLWQPGGYILRDNGRYPYSIYQNIVGVLDLRPQTLQFDETYWTADAMRIHMKGTILYALLQDEDYFREHSSRATTMDVAQRALLPNADWREKTTRVANAKMRDFVKQTAFTDYFVTPNHLNQLDLFETIRRFYTQQPLKNVAEDLRARMKNETRDRLAEWGVEIRNVIFETISPPQDLSDAAKRLHEGWMRQMDAEREAEHASRVAIEHANQEYSLAQVEQKTKVMHAETEKRVKQLNADAEAAEHETRMKARAMGAVEFARRIETLRQAMGNTLDEGTFRELLRALDLLREDDREEVEQKAMARLYNARSMRMDE